MGKIGALTTAPTVLDPLLETTDLSELETNLAVQYPTNFGREVDCGRLNPSRQYSYIRNLPSFVIFETICVAGIVLMGRRAINPQPSDSIKTLALPLLWIFLISIGVGIAAEICWRVKEIYGKLSGSSSVAFHSVTFTPNDVENNNDANTDTRQNNLHLTHHSVIEGRASLSIRVESGRPMISNVILSIIDANISKALTIVRLIQGLTAAISSMKGNDATFDLSTET